MFLIDTNIHAAYLLKRYENDEVTKRYLADYEKIPFINRVVCDFILNELELLLLKAMPPRFHMMPVQKSALKLSVFSYLRDVFTNFTLAVPTIQTMREAHELYQSYTSKSYISFTDSLILALAREHNFTILSKDARLNFRAKELRIAFYNPQAEN